MAGAAERRHAGVMVRELSPAPSALPLPRAAGGLAALRARALALPAPLIALALAGAAQAAHLALWGTSTPWSRANTAPGSASAILGSAGMPWGSTIAAGALLAAAGSLWALWAWGLLRAAGTPTGRAGTPLQLIEEGPYRLGRNPMYLGLVAVLLGAALGLASPLLGLSALLFGGIVNAVHIPHEEARLALRFGGWYRDYAIAARRWL